MKKCFGYVRVSTLKQGEGVSLDAQRDAIDAYAQRNDILVTRWFEEKVTAAKSGRSAARATHRNRSMGARRAHKDQTVISLAQVLHVMCRAQRSVP